MRPAESFIGQPIRSLQTMLRGLAEYDDEYQTLVPDGIYGQQTAASVSSFQKRHGLPVTGVTDQQTWEHIAQAYRHARVDTAPAEEVSILINPGQVIRRGERSPHLYLVQGMLVVISSVYQSVSMPSQTGVLDLPTEESLSSFQQLSGLPMTGELDKRTWKHLALQYPLAANLRLTASPLSGKY